MCRRDDLYFGFLLDYMVYYSCYKNVAFVHLIISQRVFKLMLMFI